MVSYCYGQDADEQETMNYLKFIARAPCHIFEQIALMAAGAAGYFRGIGPGYTPTIPKLAGSTMITSCYIYFAGA
ncbi:hypothetical protein D4R89_00890 [bacterium]|nr:MAG: hypothetical protein D4R89_00890 [bacterium]